MEPDRPAPHPRRKMALGLVAGSALALSCSRETTAPGISPGISPRISPATTPAPQAETPVTAPPSLELGRFAWSHRPLLVFADTPDRPALRRQQVLLADHRPGLDDRDMVVIEIVGVDITLDGRPVAANPRKLRQDHGVPADAPFAVRLLGKDSGVKLRSDGPVTAERLFALIDAMPMRRREMAEPPDRS
ncbi:MAG: DUF4174 domain-containing protein [Planctomycetota bacterium]